MHTHAAPQNTTGKAAASPGKAATGNPLQKQVNTGNPLLMNPQQTDLLQVLDDRKQFQGGNPLQKKTGTASTPPPPPKKKNNTGLPDNLKQGVEALSGYSMDDVKVHYNSSKPAQLQALAYAQGTDIHVAPGQERHLPHEAWHIVQQKQGRVQPTVQMKQEIAVKDDEGLDSEINLKVDASANLLMNNAEMNSSKSDSNMTIQLMTKRKTVKKLNFPGVEPDDTIKSDINKEKSDDEQDGHSQVEEGELLGEKNTKGLTKLNYEEKILSANSYEEVIGQCSKQQLQAEGRSKKFWLSIFIPNQIKTKTYFIKNNSEKDFGENRISEQQKDGFEPATLKKTNNERISATLDVHPALYSTNSGEYEVDLINNIDANLESRFKIKETSNIRVKFVRAGKEFGLAMRVDKLPIILKVDYDKLEPKKRNKYIRIPEKDEYVLRSENIRSEAELNKLFDSSDTTIKVGRGISKYSDSKRKTNGYDTPANEVGQSVDKQERDMLNNFDDSTNSDNTTYEWCHLIGHGDGGTEEQINFVVGSKAVNTEQLGLEKAVREWRNLFGIHKKGVKIKVSALLRRNVQNISALEDAKNNVAEAIKYEVQIVQKKYDGTNIPVYTHVMDARRKTISLEEVNLFKNILNEKLKNLYQEIIIEDPTQRQQHIITNNTPTHYGQHPNHTLATPPSYNIHNVIIDNEKKEYKENTRDKGTEIRNKEKINTFRNEPVYPGAEDQKPRLFELNINNIKPDTYIVGTETPFRDALLLGFNFSDIHIQWIVNQMKKEDYKHTWQGLIELLKEESHSNKDAQIKHRIEKMENAKKIFSPPNNSPVPTPSLKENGVVH